MRSNAPIILFVYNRPLHTKQTLDALSRNMLASESDLIIYSDHAKNAQAESIVSEVRELIDSVVGFKSVTVVKRDRNWGLANSIIDGVTTVVNKYGKVIVLEDDLVTSPYFLSYMNDNLNHYEHFEKVASIHGYVYPIDNLPKNFFIRGADCWGWGTWKRAWNYFEKDGGKLLSELDHKKLGRDLDFNTSYPYRKMLEEQINGKVNSWAIRWYVSAFLNNMLTLYPGKSYVQNIGHDNTGTHCGSSSSYNVNLNTAYDNEFIAVSENLNARLKFEIYFRSLRPSLITRVINKIKRVFGFIN